MHICQKFKFQSDSPKAPKTRQRCMFLQPLEHKPALVRPKLVAETKVTSTFSSFQRDSGPKLAKLAKSANQHTPQRRTFRKLFLHHLQVDAFFFRRRPRIRTPRVRGCVVPLALVDSRFGLSSVAPLVDLSGVASCAPARVCANSKPSRRLGHSLVDAAWFLLSSLC